MSGCVYETVLQMTGTFEDRAAARRRRIESGDTAAARLELISSGDPRVQYAVQTSIMRRAGRGPHPILLAKPEKM